MPRNNEYVLYFFDFNINLHLIFENNVIMINNAYEQFFEFNV